MLRALFAFSFAAVALVLVASTGIATGWETSRSALAQAEQVDVALDPGHSTWDVGATGAGLAEYQLTLDTAQRVRSRLEEWGYSVRLSRTDTARVAPVVPRDLIEATRVEQEARIAAASPASIFVSIHFNAHPN